MVQGWGLNWKKEGLSQYICSRVVEFWDNYASVGLEEEDQKFLKCSGRLEAIGLS